MTRRLLLVVALAGLAAACGPHRIPGTDIEDSGDTRAILDVMERYRGALEAKDVNAVLGLVDPSFRDTAGTLTPEDDIDYARLKTVLPQRLARLSDVAVRFEVKTIDVRGASASAVYTWTSAFRLGGKPVNESDIKRMEFRRTGEGWKIVSGL